MENNLFPHFCSIKSQIFFFHFLSLELQSPSAKSTCQKNTFVRTRKVPFLFRFNSIPWSPPCPVRTSWSWTRGKTSWSLIPRRFRGCRGREICSRQGDCRKQGYIFFCKKSFERILAHFFFYVSLQLKSQYFKRNNQSPPSEALHWGREKDKAKI